MAQVINNQEIYLNGKHYKIKGPVRPQTINRFAPKMTIGDDSYENETFRSNWITNDQRGGIGLEEMTDPKTQYNRCWWSQLDLAHKTLPPLATQVGLFSTWALPTGNTDPDSAWGLETQAYDDNLGTAASQANIPATTWGNFLQLSIDSASFKAMRFYATWAAAHADHQVDIDIYYGGAWNHLYQGSFTETTWVVKGFGASRTCTDMRLRFYNGDSVARTISLFEAQYLSATADTPTITNVVGCNFNSQLYLGVNTKLYRLDSSSGDAFLHLATPTGANITALTASVGNVLHIYLGDSTNYQYMSTTEVFNDAATGGAANCQNANLGIHYGASLYKMNAAGQIYFCADPARDDPTWTADGSLVNNGLASGSCQRLLTERDKDGATVIKAITKSGVYEHDGANDRFILEKPFPEHTNGGKGGLAWNDRIYYSAGLNVKRFRPGSGDPPAEEVGLDLDDGVPAEYAGEIMSLIDGGNAIYALVDASQTTGTGYSWIAKLDKYGWSCFWDARQLETAAYDSTGGTGTSWTDHANGYDNDTATFAYHTASVAAGAWSDYLTYTYSARSMNLLKVFFSSDGNGTFNEVEIGVSTDGSAWTIIYSDKFTADVWQYIPFAQQDSIIKVRMRFKNNHATTAGTPRVKEIHIFSATQTDKTMHDGIVSSSYSYRLWYDHNNLIYYIPLQRSQLSPKKISGYTYGAGPVLHVTPWFAAGAPTEAKLQALARAFCQDTTSTESVQVMYRTESAYRGLWNPDTTRVGGAYAGWKLLGTVVAAGNGISTEYSFASGAGLSYKYIQFAFVLTRGTTNTLAPVLNSYTSVFLKKNKKVWTWSFTLNLAEPSQDGTPKELQEFLETALDLGTLLEFTFLNETGTTETHYVDVINFSGWRGTGDYHQGQYEMTLLEP